MKPLADSVVGKRGKAAGAAAFDGDALRLSGCRAASAVAKTVQKIAPLGDHRHYACNMSEKSRNLAQAMSSTAALLAETEGVELIA